MSDIDIYGPLPHKLKFKDAVAAGELSGYRVPPTLFCTLLA